MSTYEEDFKGGLFHFQDGEPSTILPRAGDVVMYTADNRNVHSVDVVTEGERVTLTLWFSRDAAHDEDEKLISFLCQGSLDNLDSNFSFPLPTSASHSMYWFPPDEAAKFQSGFDIRCARLDILGLDVYSSEETYSAAINSPKQLLKSLMEPLQLAWGDELFEMKFVNILHALQAVQFFLWKYSKLKPIESEDVSAKLKLLSVEEKGKVNCLRQVVLKDHLRIETFIKNLDSGKPQCFFNWARFSAAVMEWEVYTKKSYQELHMSFPQWRKYGSIFRVPELSD